MKAWRIEEVSFIGRLWLTVGNHATYGTMPSSTVWYRPVWSPHRRCEELEKSVVLPSRADVEQQKLLELRKKYHFFSAGVVQ